MTWPAIDLISLIILLGVIQGISLALASLIIGKKTSDRYFVGICIILSLGGIESFLNYSGFMIYVPHFINVPTPFILLLGPCLFFYIKKTLNPDQKLSLTYLHYLPFLFFFIYSFYFFLQPVEIKVNAYLNSFHPVSGQLMKSPFPKDPLNIRGYFVIEGEAIHLLTYSIWSLVILLRHARKNNTFLFLHKQERNVEWLKFLTMGMFIGSLIFLGTGGVVNGKIIYASIFPSYFANYYSTFTLYLLTIYLVCLSPIFKKQQIKYLKSELPKSIRQNKIRKILQVMELEKPFLNKDFSRFDLARRASISPHHISQVINQELNSTFNDLTNSFRLQEAEKILKSPNQNSIKMEQLAYDLGYKSKSAFYNAFKKRFSLTPAKFRESVGKSRPGVFSNGAEL